MNPPGTKVRIVLVVLFVLLTLPVLTHVGHSFRPLRWLMIADMGPRAAPLYLAWTADQMFYDGGELSPQLIPVWVGLTAVMLWPLLLLGIRPTLWTARAWRRGIMTYAVTACACTVVAGYWVFTHLGAFFG